MIRVGAEQYLTSTIQWVSFRPPKSHRYPSPSTFVGSNHSGCFIPGMHTGYSYIAPRPCM